MKVGAHSPAELSRLLRRGEFMLDMAPFVVRLRSDIPSVARDLASMYGQFGVRAPDEFADFSIDVSFEPGVRRWVQPLARFYYDDLPSFTPLPARQAMPMIEWGLNWCVAAHAHQFLVIHAAVIEKGGRAAVLPAPPGSGKSTLCAGLVNRGWRLLSDELALYAMETGLLYGMARPVNLKNASIAAIRAHAPDVVMTEPVPDTTKGTVALMRPPDASVAAARTGARPAWVILPRYERGAAPMLQPCGEERAFMMLAEQSFNYDVHGARGFDALGRLIDDCRCYTFTYSALDDGARIFDQLAAGATA